MDNLPLILKNHENQTSNPVIREVFQEAAHKLVIPPNIVENILFSEGDRDYSLQPSCKNDLEGKKKYKKEIEQIENIECNLINQHGLYLVKKLDIASCELKEILKLKTCEIFNITDLPCDYALAKKLQLYCNYLRQFLDFQFNKNMNLYGVCVEKIESSKSFNNQSRSAKNIRHNTLDVAIEKDTICLESFVILPDKVIFHNYRINGTYQVTIKLVNTGPHLQSFSIQQFPRSSSLFAYLADNRKVASGMSVECKIHFHPKIYKNFKDEIVFKGVNGQNKTLELFCDRDPPLLISYVLKQLESIFDRTTPENNGFDFKRCRALNESLDCGSILVGNYSCITILLANSGEDGEFFVVSEDEWRTEELRNVTDLLELKLDSFWIYPTYFSLKKGEVTELYVIFNPVDCGLQVEHIFMICSNNTYKQLELVGDAVCFSKDLLSIDILPGSRNVNKSENHCIFLRNVSNRSLGNFVIAVQNKSCVYLQYYWELLEGSSLSSCVRLKNDNILALLPYSTTAFIFEVQPNVETEGYYTTYISLFIKGVPPLSLKEDKLFNRKIKLIPETTVDLDLLVFNSELSCYVEPQNKMQTSSSEMPCECLCCHRESNKNPQILRFSCSVLDFGIIPIGLEVERNLSIKNMSNRKVKWQIMEVKYNVDYRPYIALNSSDHLSKNHGTLKSRSDWKQISYKILKKEPSSWVSILILFLIEHGKMTAEAICMVTFEFVKFDIRIHTKNSPVPILCPMELLYPNIPITLTIYIENRSLIPGCFYFLKQMGDDANMIELEFNPQSDILKPQSTTEVRVTMISKDVGIFENIFIPCFIGGGENLIFLRILCAVDNTHLFIFLPMKENKYQKIIWPPKVLFEYDDWNYCACEHECFMGENESFNGITNVNNAVASDSGTSIQSSLETDLITNIENIDSQLFLQDNIIEVRYIEVKTPHKISIFIENLTPVESIFNVQSSNFPADNLELFKAAVEDQYKNSALLWNQLASNKNGIVVQPAHVTGMLSQFNVFTLDIWIYANTWGVYLEEIMLDIEDIPCFCFSIVIEIIGIPLEFPLCSFNSLKYPVIRFGNIIYGSQPPNRELVINNISSIPVQLRWYTFIYPNDNNSLFGGTEPFTVICDDTLLNEEMNCLFLNDYYGKETTNFNIFPRKLILEENSSKKIKICIERNLIENLELNIPNKCYAVGFILVDYENRFKSNYFYRETHNDLAPVVIEINFTVVQPVLSYDENSIETFYSVFANNIIFEKDNKFCEVLPLQNITASTITARLDTEDPLEVYVGDKIFKNKIIKVEAHTCLEIILKFNISKETIIEWSDVVYHKNPAIRDYANNREKLVKMRRALTISYLHHIKQEIPFDLIVCYPRIMVRPTHLKMDYVLVGCTKKCIITIFNLSGTLVKFEVYKSCPTDEILTRPNYGDILPSKGFNKSSVNILIYFTPKVSQTYQETIRIVTNIPQYYIDIPIKGYGSNNEKFYTELKL